MLCSYVITYCVAAAVVPVTHLDHTVDAGVEVEAVVAVVADRHLMVSAIVHHPPS